MQTIVKDQMLSYLARSRLIMRQQHGFLARHSTCTQLLECTNDLILALNSRNSVDCVYIDFNKAFDSVVHSKLYLKLTSFGFQGTLLH